MDHDIIITNVTTMVLRGEHSHGLGGIPRIWHLIVVKIETNIGLHGYGECPHWQRGYFGVRETIDYIGKRLIGKSPFEVKRIVEEHFNGARPPHQPRSLPATIIPMGPIVWAMSGIEMALLDIIGKQSNLPIHSLLGGKFRNKIPVYLDRSSPKDVQNLDEWRKITYETIKSGFSKFKFDIDYVAPDLVSDVWSRSISREQMLAIKKRLSIVRQEAGDAAEISVDCHMNYDLVSSIELSKILESLNVFWLEDPVPVMDLGVLAEIKDKSTVPICAGEMYTFDLAKLAIKLKSLDIMHPDILFAGGIYEAQKICDLANSNGLPVAFHNNSTALGFTASAHLAASVKNIIALEYHFNDAEWSKSWVRRINGAPFISNGHIELDDTPGLGCELNEEICLKLLAPGENYIG